MSTALKASNEYWNLIRRFPLRPIRSERQLAIANKLVAELAMKVDRARDEQDYYRVLLKLVEEYESKLPLLAPPMTPQEALSYLLEQSGRSQRDVAKAIGCSQGNISSFLNGNRGLSQTMVIKLADYFKVSPELFLLKTQYPASNSP